MILYYAVGPVHPRNLKLIAEEMPEFRFCMVYEPDVWWMNEESLREISFEKIPLTDEGVLPDLRTAEVEAVIFSTTQFRLAPINLLKWSIEHGIPTVAIEEANQLAFTDGRRNLYLLPVDHVLLASEVEQQLFRKDGVPEQETEVTGWPFYCHSDQTGEAGTAKRRLGLDPSKPVAALTLTSLHDLGETPDVRRHQLEIASRGLPEAYQLVVKPHPIEKREQLAPFIAEKAPRAVVIDGSVPIEDLLDATDVLLNRGNSQVVIEALLRDIPVIVLSVGYVTPFHTTTPEMVVTQPSELATLIESLETDQDRMSKYKAFLQYHVPFSPEEARRRVCQRIREIVGGGYRASGMSSRWLDLVLHLSWQVDTAKGIELLGSDRVGVLKPEADCLSRLLRKEGTRKDLGVLRDWARHGYREQILKCLWIENLERNGELLEEDLEWLEDFPTRTNQPYYFEHCRRWHGVLVLGGKVEHAAAFAARLQTFRDFYPNVSSTLRDMQLQAGGVLGRGFLAAHRYLRKLQSRMRGMRMRGILNRVSGDA